MSEIQKNYEKCVLCPRECGVNRTQKNQIGFCAENSELKVALAVLHFGEEPVLTVKGGSGAIFVTGCNLKCAFCQNYQISQNGMGKIVSEDEFAKICLALQNYGAENINIVTGSHAVPKIALALEMAKSYGLKIPICWNSSAYEKIETLEKLKNLVDVWLPDLKTLDKNLSKKLFLCDDYPQKAKKAILWMIKNFQLEVKNEKIFRGVIIRHLFLPGHFEKTIQVLSWLKKNAEGRALISLMNQFTPVNFLNETFQKKCERFERLSAIENRFVSADEDEDLRDIICALDFSEIFYQERSIESDWLPDFSKIKTFCATSSKTIWHWKCGFILDS